MAILSALLAGRVSFHLVSLQCLIFASRIAELAFEDKILAPIFARFDVSFQQLMDIVEVF